MNQRIDFSQLGGYELAQDDLEFMQESYRNAFGALASFIGSTTILTGVTVNPSTNTVTNGWIVYNGEMMPFVGGTLSSGVVVQETGQNLGFDDGTPHTVLFTKFASCGTPATFSFSALKSSQALRDIWSSYDVKEVDCPAPYIAANFDGTGLGINERQGWAICNGNNGTKDRRGRFPVGYDDRGTDPGTGWWDVLYNSIGQAGGNLNITLSALNMPPHYHVMHAGGQITRNGGGVHGFLSRQAGSLTNNYAGSGADQFGVAESPDTDMTTGSAGGSGGAAVPFKITPPFLVTLFIQKL